LNSKIKRARTTETNLITFFPNEKDIKRLRTESRILTFLNITARLLEMLTMR
jgi:hypothetical protein